MPDLVATEHITDGTAVIELAGRLDGSATTRMRQLQDVFDARVDAVVLDFTAVDYINSTGIALVVGLAAAARTARVPLRACGLTAHYAHIFRITRIADFVQIYPDTAAALAAPDGDAHPVA